MISGCLCRWNRAEPCRCRKNLSIILTSAPPLPENASNIMSPSLVEISAIRLISSTGFGKSKYVFPSKRACVSLVPRLDMNSAPVHNVFAFWVVFLLFWYIRITPSVPFRAVTSFISFAILSLPH